MISLIVRKRIVLGYHPSFFGRKEIIQKKKKILKLKVSITLKKFKNKMRHLKYIFMQIIRHYHKFNNNNNKIYNKNYNYKNLKHHQ